MAKHHCIKSFTYQKNLPALETPQSQKLPKIQALAAKTSKVSQH
jgi:hypothetical protein